ncbi:hypothetical protein CFC21_068492 [Triticum aestivum]|uniref:Uncharacterized protein n=2 Tax=Triticum aestivum TaxID=4565 RepID=A0A3B6KSS2_WHEAT|nr:hypothetical protein CFC21_068492 [Triticum aestivum]
MRVEGPFFSLLGRSVLLDAEWCPVLTVERSPSLFEITRRWEAFRGDSTSSKDLLFSAAVQPSLTNTGDIHVHLDGERRRDFVGVRPWYRGLTAPSPTPALPLPRSNAGGDSSRRPSMMSVSTKASTMPSSWGSPWFWRVYGSTTPTKRGHAPSRGHELEIIRTYKY